MLLDFVLAADPKAHAALNIDKPLGLGALPRSRRAKQDDVHARPSPINPPV